MTLATHSRMAVRLGVVVLGLAAAPPAAAYSAQLEWNAPATCPDAGALRHAVERLLGEPLTDGATVSATATVTQESDAEFALVLTLRTATDQGTRRVRTDGCQSALDVAAFGIALALNPELRLEAPATLSSEDEAESPPATREPEPAAPPPSAAPPSPAPLPPPAPRKVDAGVPSPRPSRGSPELWAAADALVDSSLLPGPALGLGVALEALVARRLRFGVAPSLFLPQEERLDGGSGGRFLLWSLRAYACGNAVTGIDVCPLFQYGMVRGEGRGVAPRLAQVSHVYAPGAAVQGSYAFGSRTLARAGAAALFPLSRDVFTVRDGELHRIPRFSFEFSLGIATRAF